MTSGLVPIRQQTLRRKTLQKRSPERSHPSYASLEAQVISSNDHGVLMNPNLVAINQEATICQVLHKGLEWQIKFQGSFWKARAIYPNVDFALNDRVYVVGRQNLTLLIQSIS